MASAACAERCRPTRFSLTAIGGGTIVTYFVIYTFGLLIGQDIWQRVFTARSPGVARWAGTAAGVYCLLYGVAGALIGMAAKVLLPDLGAARRRVRRASSRPSCPRCWPAWCWPPRWPR